MRNQREKCKKILKIAMLDLNKTKETWLIERIKCVINFYRDIFYNEYSNRSYEI